MPLFAGRVFFHQFLTIQGTNLGETVFYRNNNWMISMTVAFQQLFLHVCAHSSLQLNGGQMSFPMFAALQQCVKIFHQEKVVQHVLRNVTVHHRKHPIQDNTVWFQELFSDNSDTIDAMFSLVQMSCISHLNNNELETALCVSTN